MHEVDGTDDSFDDDAYDDILQNYDGSDWEDKLYPLSSTDAEDGDSRSIPSISVEDSEEASFSRRLNKVYGAFRIAFDTSFTNLNSMCIF